jgi:MazG family protein
MEEHPFDALRTLSARLRAPDGCPWDRAQTLESLTTYIIEEAYEVVDAIGTGDQAALAGELGDLLFQIVFVTGIAAERGWFGADDVCTGIHAKMVRRHPHVFGEVEVADAAEVVRNWEVVKESERESGGALAGVPRQLPALLKALRITEKAAAVGFDWERVDDVVAKLHEEVHELEQELAAAPAGKPPERVREELGDVLFVMANLARQLDVDPEAALQAANDKFTRRFENMEVMASSRGDRLSALTLEELDRLWDEAKRGESPPGV